jgi:hypothetical protein
LDSFKSVQTIESIYTGGKAVLTTDEQWLITSIGEDIDVTEFETGKRVYRLKGVRSQLYSPSSSVHLLNRFLLPCLGHRSRYNICC